MPKRGREAFGLLSDRSDTASFGYGVLSDLYSNTVAPPARACTGYRARRQRRARHADRLREWVVIEEQAPSRGRARAEHDAGFAAGVDVIIRGSEAGLQEATKRR
jgi:hypothetical protein